LGAALARLQQANSSPEAEAAMAYVRVATALVEEKSATSKSAASTSSRHSRSRSNRPAHSRLPTIQEEVNQPGSKAAPAVNLRANLNKNRRDRDARGYIDQRHREREEGELQRRLDYDRKYGPPGGIHRIMEREERDVTPKIPSLKKMLAIIRILFSKVNEFEQLNLPLNICNDN
jgi:hypothetical protein